MTSNIGSDILSRIPHGQTAASVREQVEGLLKMYMTPELLNRIDETLLFERLLPENMAPIVDIQLKQTASLLTAQNMTLNVTDDARVWLAKEGYSDEYGARPLRRLINKSVLNIISEVSVWCN
jgi:ATP-dependent Clp protease ATP-binding subunit ClpB